MKRNQGPFATCWPINSSSFYKYLQDGHDLGQLNPPKSLPLHYLPSPQKTICNILHGLSNPMHPEWKIQGAECFASFSKMPLDGRFEQKNRPWWAIYQSGNQSHLNFGEVEEFNPTSRTPKKKGIGYRSQQLFTNVFTILRWVPYLKKIIDPHCLQVSSTVACRSTTTQRTAICPFSAPSEMHSTTSKRRREGSWVAMGRHGQTSCLAGWSFFPSPVGKK